MTDFFKTVRAYLRGKWRKRVARSNMPIIDEPVRACLTVDVNGRVTGFDWSDGSGSDRFEITSSDWTCDKMLQVHELSWRIDSLRRNKKKHSHLQKELDALIDSGADTQTNNGDDQ